MRLARAVVVAVFAALPLLAQNAAPAKEVWVADPQHSMATFKIRHLMANVTGQFHDVHATILMDRTDPARSSIEVSIPTSTIDTGVEARDEHLRSPDFFEVKKYPAILFKSAVITPKSKTQFDVTGDLTMHGVTRRITVPVEFLGFGKDARGHEIAGFEAEMTLDRKDYEITWNKVLDEGGVLLGDEVKVTVSLEMGKKD